MDKVLSTRIDEAVITLIQRLAHDRRMPKKRVLEEAVRCYWRESEKQGQIDILEETCGAWKRTESPRASVEQARKPFRESMGRHQVS